MNVIRTSVRASLRRNRLALALLSVATAPAIAQPAADAADVSTLDTVVVTASGFEQKITDAPASISVISLDELLERRYGSLAEALVADIEGEPVDLIETLASRLLCTCLAAPLVRAATVTVHKPSAPIRVPFTDVTVTVTGSRS